MKLTTNDNLLIAPTSHIRQSNEGLQAKNHSSGRHQHCILILFSLWPWFFNPYIHFKTKLSSSWWPSEISARVASIFHPWITPLKCYKQNYQKTRTCGWKGSPPLKTFSSGISPIFRADGTTLYRRTGIPVVPGMRHPDTWRTSVGTWASEVKLIQEELRSKVRGTAW